MRSVDLGLDKETCDNDSNISDIVPVPFRLTMNSNLAGTSESRLMLIRSRPASFSLGRSLAKFMPLVVAAMVFRPSNFLSSAVEGEQAWGQEEERRESVREYLHPVSAINI